MVGVEDLLLFCSFHIQIEYKHNNAHKSPQLRRANIAVLNYYICIRPGKKQATRLTGRAKPGKPYLQTYHQTTQPTEQTRTTAFFQ